MASLIGYGLLTIALAAAFLLGRGTAPATGGIWTIGVREYGALAIVDTFDERGRYLGSIECEIGEGQ